MRVVARTLLTTLAGSLLLAGCAEPNLQDLQEYSRKMQTQAAPRVDPLPEFPEQETYQYQSFDQRSPFMPPQSVETVIQQLQSQNIRPDSNRTKEPLERFRVESLRMVGTIKIADGALEALILDPEGVVHTVGVGNYVGSNNGKVIDISENAIELREIVSNGQGGWLERPRPISMAEQ